jgi:hypothetical protein
MIRIDRGRSLEMAAQRVKDANAGCRGLREDELAQARAVASQNYEEHRNAGPPPLALFKDQAEEVRRQKEDELSIRRYLGEKNLLTIPSWVPHYQFVPMPSYLSPFSDVTEADDFTSPSRLHQNSTRYIDPPSPALGYFALTMAKDPRAEMVHEDIPGHYLQLALSWAHPDPIRRHYYDSSANEGLGFYAEEMMLHSRLFDDRPRTREIIWKLHAIKSATRRSRCEIGAR